MSSLLSGLVQDVARLLREADIQERLLDTLQEHGFLEGSRSCSGCRELVEDDFEHDFCVCPPDVHEDVAYQLLPELAVYQRTVVLRTWKFQEHERGVKSNGQD